jgi:transposase
LTTKIHALCDANLRPSVIVLGPGQGGDSPMFLEVLGSLRVSRLGGGRPRTTPDRAMGDKAYSSRANRKMLRDRGIHAVIPERSDQVANRKRRGQAGGRPPTFDKVCYKCRNVIERCFEVFTQWRGIVTRYDELALPYRGGVVLRSIIIWVKALGDTP